MKIFGLIGYPVEHSLSAGYFNTRFAQEGIDATYRLFPLKTIDELPKLLNEYPELVGLNVTSPYKEKVGRFVDRWQGDTLKIRATNLLRIERHQDNSSILGIEAYNTDVFGFEYSLRQTIGENIPYRQALIFGTGGAAKAVGIALDNLGIPYYWVSRSPSADRQIHYDKVSAYLSPDMPTLLVNATPIGMDGKTLLPLPYHLLSSEHLCYDLIYHPKATPFLLQAEKQGIKTMNGLLMLRLQAEEGWGIWGL